MSFIWLQTCTLEQGDSWGCTPWIEKVLSVSKLLFRQMVSLHRFLCPTYCCFWVSSQDQDFSSKERLRQNLSSCRLRGKDSGLGSWILRGCPEKEQGSWDLERPMVSNVVLHLSEKCGIASVRELVATDGLGQELQNSQYEWLCPTLTLRQTNFNLTSIC